MSGPAEAWASMADWAAGPVAPGDRARDEVVLAVTDTVACMLAGWDEPAALAARTAADDTPGDRALALGAAAHALDWDDYETPGFSHPSAVLVPVLLALPRDGANTAAAYVAGLEVIMAAGRMVNPDCYARGFHTTGLLGALGAAVTAGRLLGLDGPRMLAALSLAAGSASGLKAQFGTPAKALNAGIAARTGITAARLAAAGAAGKSAALWGATGLAGLFGGADSAAFEPLMPDGSGIENPGLIRKPWPCCGYLQRVLRDVHALSLDPEEIDSVAIAIPPRNRAVVPFDRPTTPDEARFSAPHAVACMIVNRGQLGPTDFTAEAVGRSEVTALASCITVTPAGARQGPGDLSPDDPDHLTITLRSGEIIERTCDRLPGLPDDPETPDWVGEKLLAATEDALDPVQTETLAGVLARLDTPALARMLGTLR